MKRLVGLLMICAILGSLFGCIPGIDLPRTDTDGGYNLLPNIPSACQFIPTGIRASLPFGICG